MVFSLHPLHSSSLPASHPTWWHLSKIHMVPSLPCVHICICDHQNVSMKLLYVSVCLSSGDLFIFLVRVSLFFSYFVKWNIHINNIKGKPGKVINTKKYHVFAPMGRFQLELIYLYFPPSSHLVYLCFFHVGLSLI